MKRIKVVLAVASMTVLLVAFAAAPAMAKGNMNNDGNDRHLDQRDIQLDQRLLNDVDDLNFVSFEEPFFLVVPSLFDDSCPFAGDTEGIVNEFDCFG